MIYHLVGAVAIVAFMVLSIYASGWIIGKLIDRKETADAEEAQRWE